MSYTPTTGNAVNPRAFTATSYNFQTYADFNGIDWSETGLKVSSGTAGTMNAFSYGASGLGFAAPSLTGDVAGINPTISNGSVEVNGASFTYSGTTQYAYLDDNGTWQAASSPSSNTAYFGVGQTTNWSVSGSGALSPSNAEAYGNGISGTANVSGSGTDMYDYRQYYSYSSADGGEWTPTGSGDGSATGGGAVTYSFSASGGYSNADSEWSPSDIDSPAGTAQTAAWLGQTQNGSWSGSVSASGNATQGYGYSTDSTYTSADGWTSTGTTSASVGGSMEPLAVSWPASPFAHRSSSGSATAITARVVRRHGFRQRRADWANYSFAQSQNHSGGAWSSASGAGGASGGSSATWGYSGSGSYSQTQDGGTVNGGLSGSGNQTYSLGYNESASMSPGDGWTQSGTGDASATAAYGYYYNGSGGGTTPAGDFYFPLGTSWTIRGESGSGGGTYNYDDALTLGEDGWSGASSTESENPSVSGTSSQTDSYGYHSSGSTSFWDGSTSSSTNDITENGTTTTQGSGWPGYYATTGTMFGGSGSASGTYDHANNELRQTRTRR